MADSATDNLSLQMPATVLPEWVEVIPSGPEVIGIDGRRWLNDVPDRIVDNFQTRGRLMVIDWEHATECRAPNGLDAPAAGWIDQLEIRAGAIWAHVKEWTERARQQLAERAYKFLSPAFLFERNSGRILSLTSVALTNAPNLPLTALNSRQRTTGKGEPALTHEECHAARLLGLAEADVLKTKQAEYDQAQNAVRLAQVLSPEELRVCEVMGVKPATYLENKYRTV